MEICYIGIGSNLGDRYFYLESAIRRMRLLPETRVLKISRSIETKPVGGPPQGPYLNAVIEISTGLGPYQLLSALQKIESDLGRVRLEKNGPRTIDLDILTYGNTVIEERALSVPHPCILERAFVLVPLREVAPEAVEKVKYLLQDRGHKKGRAKRVIVKRNKPLVKKRKPGKTRQTK